jgi:hypothetical protein
MTLNLNKDLKEINFKALSRKSKNMKAGSEMASKNRAPAARDKAKKSSPQ